MVFVLSCSNQTRFKPLPQFSLTSNEYQKLIEPRSCNYIFSLVVSMKLHCPYLNNRVHKTMATFWHEPMAARPRCSDTCQKMIEPVFCYKKSFSLFVTRSKQRFLRYRVHKMLKNCGSNPYHSATVRPMATKR